ncbi:plasmid recombination protein [Burkholderia multivorans]|uniref:MobV family relaxase n=1 Tax=Burkholderiaceae TaxID=119060 RepID=UPI0009E29F5B|nr:MULTISPECIES: MobV family relaxase [Burkholderiaceae]MBU9593348.1 plasmid recombination protein [Burkholderia multivorans]MCA8452403.1 plasmid recombination protein [Burkholderia multivorans]MDN7446813.1 MobV family relaxase [Burkholderia multivorans]
MANYAITRIKKYTNVGSASYLINHHLRLVHVANSNPSKTSKNVTLEKKDDIMGFLCEVPKGTKKNACRFVDVFFGASEFKDKRQLDEWVKSTMDFARKEWGANNIALAVLHKDETTPHIHVIFKPVNPKTKKLGAGYWFDGKAKMTAYQDKYHKAVEALGFERGDPTKRAHHTTIKEFYAKAEKAKTAYAEYHKSLWELYEEVGKVKLWGRLNPAKLQATLKPIFARVSAKAKKVIGLKEFLEVDKTTKQNAKLLDQLDYQAMQLEALTGSPNPTPNEVQEISKVLGEFRSNLDKSTSEIEPNRAGPEQDSILYKKPRKNAI